MSTRLTMGRLNASQSRTNRAPFWDAAMSNVPARIRGWFATNADGHAAQAGERGDELSGPPRPQLPELAVVTDGADHVPAIVRCRLPLRDHGPQLRRRTEHRVPERRHGRQLVGARRQVLEQLDHRAVDVVGLDRAQAAGRGVGRGPAERRQSHLDTRELRHHLGPRHERHRVAAHHDEVGETEQQRRPRHDRPRSRRRSPGPARCSARWRPPPGPTRPGPPPRRARRRRSMRRRTRTASRDSAPGPPPPPDGPRPRA